MNLKVAGQKVGWSYPGAGHALKQGVDCGWGCVRHTPVTLAHTGLAKCDCTECQPNVKVEFINISHDYMPDGGPASDGNGTFEELFQGHLDNISVDKYCISEEERLSPYIGEKLKCQDSLTGPKNETAHRNVFLFDHDNLVKNAIREILDDEDVYNDIEQTRQLADITEEPGAETDKRPPWTKITFSHLNKAGIKTHHSAWKC